jgi:RND family efflux transporter MFP subunit
MNRRVTFLSLNLLFASIGHADSGAVNHFECLIEPFQRVELRSSVEALIRAVHVDRGDLISKEQVLVELDAGVEKAALDGAVYRSTMEGETKTAKTRLLYASEKLSRREELIKENYISLQDRDDTLSEKRLAEAELIQASDNKKLAGLEQQRLKEVVKLRTLKAPFSGIVTERLQNPGELAFTGESATPILKLAQIDPLRVEVILPLKEYGKIQLGAKAQIVPELPLEGRWQATVKIVDPIVDAASGTFGVRLELSNPQKNIPAGVKCQVQFE